MTNTPLYNEEGDLTDSLNKNPFSSRRKMKLPPGYVYREEWERIHLHHILEMVTARFEWTGLPEKAPSFYLERQLTTKGHALIFEDPEIGYLLGSGSMEGLNHYQEPTHYNVVSPTYSNRFNLATDKSVLVKNNSIGRSDLYTITRYVKTLAEIKMTKAVNMNSLKTPYILSANDKTKSSLTRQLDQIEQGETRVIVDQDLDKTGSGIGVFNTSSPYHIDKLQNEFLNVKQELYELLGINTNPQVNKRERVISSEVQANSLHVGYNLYSQYEMRKKAAEDASELLNKEITVEMRGYDDFANVFHGSDSTGLSDRTSGVVGEPRHSVEGHESGSGEKG